MYRVAEFIPTLSNGGAETLVKDYALNIDRSVIDLKIIIVWDLKNSINSNFLRANNIPYVTIYKKHNLLTRAFHKVFGKQYIAYKLLRVLKREQIQCLHIHMHVLDVIKCISNRIKGIKLLFTCHSTPKEHFLNEKERNTLRYLIKNNNLRLVALHENMVAELNEMFAVNNTVCMLNGIDISRFSGLTEDKATIRKALGLPENAFIVGHVGRFETVKNHSLIIEVFNELCKMRSDAHLLLVGHGSLLEKIKEKIKEYSIEDKVTILSFRNDVPRILKAMDVFIFPSTYEGLPISLIEAQIAGLPCVVSSPITEMTFVSREITVLGLEDTVAKWANALVSNNYNGTKTHEANDYDITNVMRKLEHLYISEIEGR